MSLCEFCLSNFTATDEAQLASRRKNMAANPHVAVAPCPQCDGTEWATTELMIKPDSPPWYRRLLSKEKK